MNYLRLISAIGITCCITACGTLKKEGIEFSDNPDAGVEQIDDITQPQNTKARQPSRRASAGIERELNNSVEQEDNIIRQLKDKPQTQSQPNRKRRLPVSNRPLTEADKEIDRDPLQDF